MNLIVVSIIMFKNKHVFDKTLTFFSYSSFKIFFVMSFNSNYFLDKVLAKQR